MKAAIFVGVGLAGIIASGYLLPIGQVSAASAASAEAPVVTDKAPNFVKLPRVILPIMYDNKIVQMVEVNLIAEVKDDKTVDKVNDKAAQIQNALFTALHGTMDETVGMRGEMVDIIKVKRRAAKALAGIVGKDHINDLLVDSIRQRKS